MRQDQPCDARSSGLDARLEDLDRRRRHLLAATRQERTNCAPSIPRRGIFGVVPGTNRKTNHNAYDMIQRDTIFTNVAVTADDQPWWEGLDRGRPQSTGRVARTSPAAARPRIRIRGSRSRRSRTRSTPRSPTLPRVCRSPQFCSAAGGVKWRRSCTRRATGRHGVLVGAGMASETTAAAVGQDGRRASRPDGDETLLRLQLRRLLGALARLRRQGEEAAEDLPRQLVPAGQERPLHVARASGRTCGSCAGSPTAATARPARSKLRSASSPAGPTSIPRVST